MMVTISVLGCGWLGLPLASKLAKQQYKVNGSTTSVEKLPTLEAENIKPFLLSFNPELQGEGNFFDAEVLIINIPPRARKVGEAFHLEQIEHICKSIELDKSVKSVIFVSSTSVYEANNTEVKEENADPSHFLVKAEQVLAGFCIQNNINLTVLRCGGLMGYERIPCKYFSGKDDVDTGHVPVNYVHRDDVVGVIFHIIENNIWNETFNVVSPEHPTKKELLLVNCPENNYVLPTFSESIINKPFKTVSVQKLLDKADYEFIFPDPLLFKYLK